MVPTCRLCWVFTRFWLALNPIKVFGKPYWRLKSSYQFCKPRPADSELWEFQSSASWLVKRTASGLLTCRWTHLILAGFGYAKATTLRVSAENIDLTAAIVMFPRTKKCDLVRLRPAHWSRGYSWSICGFYSESMWDKQIDTVKQDQNCNLGLELTDLPLHSGLGVCSIWFVQYIIWSLKLKC